MTSTIKVNTITTESGSTLTVGGCGKTVALASGASQTGFGRTGTVDWQTTKKTLAFTAVNGEGYFVDTAASGAVTMTLPSSPSAGNIVAVKDYNGNFASANLTIGRNGSPINGGSSSDVVISTDGASIVLVYVDGTQGWVATQDDESVFTGDSFIAATGGTITTCGNCKIHTFTGPGTFAVSSASSCASLNVVSYMIVAGGGGGGYERGGGGGAGGFREIKNPATPYTASPLDGYGTPANRITVSATPFPVGVGGGGAGRTSSGSPGTTGSNSNFSTIVSAGGGGGGSHPTPGPTDHLGAAGGSGGGVVVANLPAPTQGGAGNTPPTTPPQGNPAGATCTATGSNYYYASSGGGATAAGSQASGSVTTGTGGAGATTSINATPTAYAGGGGGGGNTAPTPQPGGAGGGGSGGKNSVVATAGTTNTGGGGGGGNGQTSTPYCGGAGGSGIVIIRYKFQ
jgi:hypothetical protein